jgi:hypothetical protein
MKFANFLDITDNISFSFENVDVEYTDHPFDISREIGKTRYYQAIAMRGDWN